ncbi:cation diffusion facilitator family transporter [Lawsonella clevelandensis]|uniref:cation diffusion facilitator family transporter n=1 Tax=Lawsonella clevelandensis TaxID=1528099 RepID=UPI003D7C16CF
MISSLVASHSGEMDQQSSRRTLTKYAWLSIAAAVITIALKMTAWRITGSVGLFSDAAESIVNLVAAVVALIVLIVAARPADKEHQFGHTKAEYFSAVTEGAMIFVAAGVIIVSAAQRLLHPQPLEDVGIALLISVVATLVNGGVALILLRGAKKHRSITLKADGKHLMTDVYTTVGVLAAVGIVALTHWYWMDPVIAIAVGINILWTGWKVMRESLDGLMDGAMSEEYQASMELVLDKYRGQDVGFHAVRNRASGFSNFIEFDVLVPGDWTVKQGHDLVHDIEEQLMLVIPDLHVQTHVEPREDPLSYDDLGPLDEPFDPQTFDLQPSTTEKG